LNVFRGKTEKNKLGRQLKRPGGASRKCESQEDADRALSSSKDVTGTQQYSEFPQTLPTSGTWRHLIWARNKANSSVMKELMTQKWNGGCLGEDHWAALLQTVLPCLRSQHKYNPQHRVISTETNFTVFILRRTKAKAHCNTSLSKDFPSVKDLI